MNLRRGTPDDVPGLDAIALAAKAHWGYSPEQMAAWQEDLRVKPESLERAPVCLAEENGQTLGFVQIGTDSQPWELESLWVHPCHMRKGVGKALVQWATQYAIENGQGELAIDADPNAAGFYLACGAQAFDSVAAPIPGQPHRVRPQLRLPTTAA
jgi:ribosomal protein S18 acetylase RimI-like enzyme